MHCDNLGNEAGDKSHACGGIDPALPPEQQPSAPRRSDTRWVAVWPPQTPWSQGLGRVRTRLCYSLTFPYFHSWLGQLFLRRVVGAGLSAQIQ